MYLCGTEVVESKGVESKGAEGCSMRSRSASFNNDLLGILSVFNARRFGEVGRYLSVKLFDCAIEL